MAKVMSPLAPEREMSGASCAYKYYSQLDYSPKQIIESSENLYWYLCKIAGYEFASGFRHTATTIAISKTLKFSKRLDKPVGF